VLTRPATTPVAVDDKPEPSWETTFPTCLNGGGTGTADGGTGEVVVVRDKSGHLE
jgi:hypothetical protein